MTRSVPAITSATSAALAGRYMFANRPASAARATSAARFDPVDSRSIAAADPVMESAIVPRRPSRSASPPPSAAAAAAPAAYDVTGSPDRASGTPRLAAYVTRKGRTKLPRLLT